MDPRTNVHHNATGKGCGGSFNVINSYNNTYADEMPQVLEWLSPLEPRVRHQDVRTNRVDGVGGWLLQSGEFINWRDGKCESDRAILFCSGAPGVGKTHLSSLVIDTLCDQSVGQKVAVACFYCDFQYHKTQTAENILGSLIKQLIRGLGVIPAEIDDAFRRAKSQVGGRGLRVYELLPLLRAAISPLEKAFICIDALDECLGRHLPELLRSLYTVSQWSPKIRFFITGRPHIHREIEKHFPGGAQFAEIKPTMEDIIKYLEMMLGNDPVPEAMNADLKAEIIKQVSETISDVFLLVSLNITAILAEATIYDRREQLKRMTNGLGLGYAYRVALDRIEAQGGAKSRFGMATLMWISRSERPMTADELCHALGVQIGSTNLNYESIPSIQTLLASCLGLITVDKVESTVRLVHFTLQEYLDSHSEIFRNPYVTMAEVCLTYLNYNIVTIISRDQYLDFAPPMTPLLEYASTYWGHYARNETTESVMFLALRLLVNFESHISAQLLLRPRFHHLIFPERRPKGFTGLHCVAYLGLDEIASVLLLKDGDKNTVDCLGRTPLIWAAGNGHEGITKRLLKRKDINFNTKDAECGRTALSWAAEGGYEKIVKLLLDRDETDAESRDNSGRTPLSWAAKSGDTGVVKLFLDREEVNVESRDNYGSTPLSYAARYRNAGVVKLLLEQGEANAESRDDCGRTELSYAAQGGDERTVKLFLDREEVNAESRDDYGSTPLSYAAQHGGERTVKLFLDREEVNPESRDICGVTPLSRAALFGNAEVVKLFLEREEVNVESRDYNGRTPLSYAARSKNERTVKLFLEREEVNVESRDNKGRTPLSYAAECGTEGTVTLLLEQEGVNAESRDNCGRTPLSHAAKYWYRGEGIVKLFLERERVNAESRDINGRTPLFHAIKGGRLAIVKLFLEWEGVNAESRDNNGRTPLSYAAGCIDERVVKLLLEREEVNAESRDNNGRTPLTYAAKDGRGRAVELFLERGDVDAESRDNSGRTPLSYAAQSGEEEPVRQFLEREEVNADSQDSRGRTPLFYALKSGSKEIGKMLLERREVNPRSRALLKDKRVARSLRQCLQSMPVARYPDARTPNPHSGRDGREVESPAQCSLQSQDAKKHTAFLTSHSSSRSRKLKSRNTHRRPRARPPRPPRAHPAPPAAAATGSLESSRRPPRRRFSQAFENEPLAHITSKRKKS